MLGSNPDPLPLFHPLTTLRRWENGAVEFRIADALTNVLITGATGSGKTSGPAKGLAYGYLAAQFGGVVLCAKVEERRQWEAWARETRREKDLVIIDRAGTSRFNFLNWETERAGEGAGLTINIVALLDEISQAIASSAGQTEGGGDSKFFEDALHHMNTNAVDLALLAGVGVSLPLLRSIVISAPQGLQEAASEHWQATSDCAQLLKLAHQATLDADPDIRADFEECRNYWLKEFPQLSDRSRSIVVLSFSMMVRPFITRPLRRLFSEDTNIRPEDTFNGKIIIVDLPVQEYRLAGRVANLVWKYCFQVAALRRAQPTDGTYLRPVFLWADEFQNFISPYDFMFASVCRSASACMAVMVQNRDSLVSVLGQNNEAMVDSLFANLQAKFFCQNSGKTNEWASGLIGEHWENVANVSTGRSAATSGERASASSGVSMSRERVPYVETVRFATLRRGGPANEFKVEAILYLGGHLFDGNMPYKLVTFRQQ